MLLHTDLVDRLFSAPGAWSLRRCANAACGLTWLDPEPVAADLADLCVGYYTHRLTAGKWGAIRRAFQRASSAALNLTRVARERRMLLNRYLENSPPGRVLEVGCGAGERLSRFRALGWDVMGQEVDTTAASGAEKRTGAHVHVGPVEDLVAQGQSFDAVVMNHVIEHVLDPVSLLASCRRLLKPGGQLVCVTPNTDSWGLPSIRQGLALPRSSSAHRALHAAGTGSNCPQGSLHKAIGLVDLRQRAGDCRGEPAYRDARPPRHDPMGGPAGRARRVLRSCPGSGDELVLRCVA